MKWGLCIVIYSRDFVIRTNGGSRNSQMSLHHRSLSTTVFGVFQKYFTPFRNTKLSNGLLSQAIFNFESGEICLRQKIETRGFGVPGYLNSNFVIDNNSYAVSTDSRQRSERSSPCVLVTTQHCYEKICPRYIIQSCFNENQKSFCETR